VNTLDAINNLPFDAVEYQNRELDRWEVLRAFKDMIYPEAVRMFPDQKVKSIDLLVRYESSEDVLDYEQFMNIQAGITSAFKIQNPEYVTVDSVRKTVSAVEAYSVAEVDGLGVHWIDNVGRVPYTVKNIHALSASYCNATAEEVVDEYVRNVVSTLK
jgi:hypothetical protein